MGGKDEFDLEKFLKEIDEAIPKYKKTLEFIEDQKIKADFPIDEELEEEAEKIKEAIKNLELTKQVYSRDLPLKALTAKEEKPISKEEKEKIKTFTMDAILKEPDMKDHVNEILKGQQKDRQTASHRYQETGKRSWRLFFVGLGSGGLIGFLASYAVALLTQKELPTVIFTNGTVIYP